LSKYESNLLLTN